MLGLFRKRPVDQDAETGRERSDSASVRKFAVVRESKGVNGRTLLHIEPAPLSLDGIPELSEDLARLLKPYFNDEGSVAVRFIDQGLPTTTTAVLGSVTIGDDEISITYGLRMMVFATGEGTIAANIHLLPIARNLTVSGARLYQEIPEARTYEFREVYDDFDSLHADLERISTTVHAHFRKIPPGSTEHEEAPEPQQQSGEAPRKFSCEWSGWEIRGNEVMCGHRIRNFPGEAPAELQIHCTLSTGIFGHVDPFLNILVRWPHERVKEQDVLQASLSTFDDSVETGWFPVLAATAPDGSTVVNVPEREAVHRCLRLLRSGQNFTFQLKVADSVRVLVLPNDDRFGPCFHECCERVRSGAA